MNMPLWVWPDPRLNRRLVVIGVAPVLFWILATGRDIVWRKPGALEAPLVYLVVTWVVYLPVFALTGVLVVVFGRLFARRSAYGATAIGVILGAGFSVLCLVFASTAYRLPMRVWPLCLVVGAAMGGTLGRVDDRSGGGANA